MNTSVRNFVSRMDQNRLLGDNDYDNAIIHQLVPGSVLDHAIRSEPWLNASDATRRRWVRLMNNPNTSFIGVIFVIPRRQFELTIIMVPDVNQPQNRWFVRTMVILADFDRFIGPNPA